MIKAELIKKIEEELAHIPKGQFQQNQFRMIYNDYREHDLSEDSMVSATHALQIALDYMNKKYPEFIPTYDKDFFV